MTTIAKEPQNLSLEFIIGQKYRSKFLLTAKNSNSMHFIVRKKNLDKRMKYNKTENAAVL